MKNEDQDMFKRILDYINTLKTFGFKKIPNAEYIIKFILNNDYNKITNSIDPIIECFAQKIKDTNVLTKLKSLLAEYNNNKIFNENDWTNEEEDIKEIMNMLRDIILINEEESNRDIGAELYKILMDMFEKSQQPDNLYNVLDQVNKMYKYILQDPTKAKIFEDLINKLVKRDDDYSNCLKQLSNDDGLNEIREFLLTKFKDGNIEPLLTLLLFKQYQKTNPFNIAESIHKSDQKQTIINYLNDDNQSLPYDFKYLQGLDTNSRSLLLKLLDLLNDQRGTNLFNKIAHLIQSSNEKNEIINFLNSQSQNITLPENLAYLKYLDENARNVLIRLLPGDANGKKTNIKDSIDNLKRSMYCPPEQTTSNINSKGTLENNISDDIIALQNDIYRNFSCLKK